MKFQIRASDRTAYLEVRGMDDRENVITPLLQTYLPPGWCVEIDVIEKEGPGEEARR